MTVALLLSALVLTAPRCVDPERMVVIRAGSFWIGSDDTERRLAYSISGRFVRKARWFEAELPRRERTLPAFCIDRHLVTQAEYAVFVTQAGHRSPGITKAEYRAQGFLVHDYDREVIRYVWTEARPPHGLADHPVVLVTVSDAEAYCRWRDARGRLPTEAEWEKAARGVDGRVFPWGNRWDPERLNSATRGPRGTTAVTRYPAGQSPFGMFDAVGNDIEWTASVLANGRQVLKSCAWDDDPGLCRPAFRHSRPAASRHILIGFRCAGPTESP